MLNKECLLCGAMLASIDYITNAEVMRDIDMKIIGITDSYHEIAATCKNGCHTRVTASKIGSPASWNKTKPVAVRPPKTDEELDFEWKQARERDVFAASQELKHYKHCAPDGPDFAFNSDTLTPSKLEAFLVSLSGLKGWRVDLNYSMGAFSVTTPERKQFNDRMPKDVVR